METSPLSTSLKQGGSRKGVMPVKDLWSAVRSGTSHDVDIALAAIKKNNASVDARNSFGSTAIHIAVWRNHIPIVKKLLSAGADPDIRDGESGWTSLHRALHFGHLAVAGVLIEAGASLSIEDFKGRIPVDLLSGPVRQIINDTNNAGGTEVFSWGNGANYQLGTGTAGIQKLPCRLDVLQGLHVTAIAAAKFHSMAVTEDGKLYSWGFGRGGRLGHPDFDIHSGQVAVITPRWVSFGLGNRRVRIIAVAKHHSLAATEGGEVFTWGSNREGQLGYTSVDSQPTPRKVTALKARVVAAAVANKHSAVLTDSGEVFTWGCNREGQLGYGTSNSASNHIPRAVEYLKGKTFYAVSAAKYHTVVLGLEGEVFTWGYKMVMPRRVLLTRNTRKAGNTHVKFHQAERLHIVSIAAGTTHTTVVSEDGLVFYWVSSDPNIRCHQLTALAGHHAVGVAAGKCRTAVVTEHGDIYAWDGENGTAPVPFRIHGIKHATHISVGENHSLAVASLYLPKFPPTESPPVEDTPKEIDDSDEDIFDDEEMGSALPANTKLPSEGNDLHVELPSLKELCENVIAQQIVEPKNALQLLEVADSLGASKLRKHCEDLVLHNLDYLLNISSGAFANASASLLADVEKALDTASSQPWSHRLLPTPTALFPAVVESEEDDSDVNTVSRMRSLSLLDIDNVSTGTRTSSEGLFHQESELERAAAKQLRALKKKLQQIEALELKQSKGYVLDSQQEAKLESKKGIMDAILAIESGVPLKSIETGEKWDSCLPGLTEVSQGKVGRSHGGHKKKKKATREQPYAGDAGLKSKTEQSFNLNNGKGQHASKDAQLLIAEPPPEYAEALAKDTMSTTISCIDECEITPSHNVGLMIAASSKQNDSIKKPVWGNTTQGFHTQPLQQHPLLSTEQNSKKKKNKKGGLSMFLSGALDKDSSKQAPPPPPPTPIVPKNDGPAWGGVHRKKSLSSLRDIQSQQTEEAGSSVSAEDPIRSSLQSKGMKGKQFLADAVDLDRPETGASKIPLGAFIRTSSAIPVTPSKSKTTSSGNPDSSPTPWAGTSPLTSASSFKAIQSEQVKHKVQQKHLSSQTSSKGFNPVKSPGSSSASEKGLFEEKVTSCWYKPDMRNPSSIRCIQLEEKAIQELSRIYKNTKVVRAGDP